MFQLLVMLLLCACAFVQWLTAVRPRLHALSGRFERLLESVFGTEHEACEQQLMRRQGLYAR